MTSQSASGYQQAIMRLNGSQVGEYFAVRNINKHYIDCVAPLFHGRRGGGRPYLQKRRGEGAIDYWVVKSMCVSLPELCDVVDWRGFCRGFIELQGCFDLRNCKTRQGDYVKRPRLRIFGQLEDLEALNTHLPAARKKIQCYRQKGGQTYALYYQSEGEICDIMDFIQGYPLFTPIWDKWVELYTSYRASDAD